MKTIYLLMFFLTSQLLSAQPKDSIDNSLVGKKWALQFEVASNFSVRPFGGFAIALKYHLTGKSAFRIALGLDYADTRSDRTGPDYWWTNVRDYHEVERISLDYILYPS